MAGKHLHFGIKELVQRYKDGSLSPLQVVERAFNDAVKWKNINAFITLTPDLAHQQAEESFLRYRQGKPLSPLDGVPIALKDNFCTKGIRTTCSSKMLANFVPPYNATVYERLINAGAILIGKTNMDEFAMGSGTINSIFGPAKNIWSEDLSNENWRITGGSSGGSALAVASGICFAAIGSDTGGSVRNPASYCGVVGLKPSYGLVSRHGLIPLVHSMDAPGIFTRTISDCALVLNAIAGPDDRDSTTIKQSFQPIDMTVGQKIDISDIRVGIPKEYHCPGLSTEVEDVWRSVAHILQRVGCEIRELSMPYTAASLVVYSILNQTEVASNFSCYDGIEYGHRADVDISTDELYATTRSEGFNFEVKMRILAGNYFLLCENYAKFYKKALSVRRLIQQDFTNVFTTGGVDVLLTPTTLTDAPLYREVKQFGSSQDESIEQDFCTQAANMAGVPAISIPIRLSANMQPIGLQLMSARGKEHQLLSVAQWIEQQVKFESLRHEQMGEQQQPRYEL